MDGTQNSGSRRSPRESSDEEGHKLMSTINQEESWELTSSRKAGNQGGGGVMKGESEAHFIEGRSNEMSPALLRGWDDAEGFLCFSKDVCDILGIGVLFVLCRR